LTALILLPYVKVLKLSSMAPGIITYGVQKFYPVAFSGIVLNALIVKFACFVC